MKCYCLKWSGHAQRHTNSIKQNWAKQGENSKRPWFCKSFQTGVCNFNKDHKVGGKTQASVSFLSNSRASNRLTHAEKYSFFHQKC